MHIYTRGPKIFDNLTSRYLEKCFKTNTAAINGVTIKTLPIIVTVSRRRQGVPVFYEIIIIIL